MRYPVEDDTAQTDRAEAVLQSGAVLVPNTALLETAWVLRASADRDFLLEPRLAEDWSVEGELLSTSMLALVALTTPAFAAYGSDQSSSPFLQADLHPGAGMLANNNFGGPKDESGNDRRGPRDGGDVPGRGKPTSSGQDGG